MNKIKEYIKTLLKLAIQNNPEVLKVVRNAKVENGAAFEAKHPRKNDGTFTETNSQSFYNEDTKTIELKGNELGSTDEEIRENGLKYFKENYQGKKFDNPELKGILFSRAGLNKLKSNSADIEKIKAIPALKDIVEKGEYMGSEDLAHPRQDGIIKFHRINHDVSINGQKENMSVLIGEDRDGNRFYNLNNKTYIAENSSRVIRAKGRADEEFSINIITEASEDFNPKTVNMKKNEVSNDKWITIHPNGEDNKGRHPLLKDGENVYEAMQRQWGISSPGQQHLFSVSKYKTDDNYKKELDAKIAELNKQVEKSREEESKRKEERIQKDAEIMMLDKFLLKHRKSSFGGDYFKATDFWEKHYKDYHTKAENGGSGSGNFDHNGRPGQVGGSLPYDSKLSDKQNEAFFKKWENAPEIKLKPSDWDNISDIKKLRQEVKKYLLSDMRKIPLHRKELGDIRFSGKSIDEFITYSADRDKLLAAKQLPQFIEEGKLGEYFDSPKDRSKQDTIKGFYPIYFNLKTSTDARKAEILIAKDDNGKLFFDMFLDYDRDKAQLKRALNGNLNPVALNSIITETSEDFNPDMKKNVQNNKEQDMTGKIENEKEEIRK